MSSNVELVGILNFTPDSFSDGGQYEATEEALQHARHLRSSGAAIIDVGAESTRPGAEPVSADEEWRRLEPVLTKLIPDSRYQISLDTYHPETLRRAAQLGTFIINDVTGFTHGAMREVAAQLRVPCILSHLPHAAAGDIQKAHRERKIDSLQQVYEEVLQSRDRLIAAGVAAGDIILDPGVGFGKTRELNWQLLAFGSLVKDHDVMIGASRKRFLGERRMELSPNLEAARLAVAGGAKYLRVHDVAGHYTFLQSQGQL